MGIQAEVKVGDVLNETADCLLTTINPTLKVKGGVVGGVLARGENTIQAELDKALEELKKPQAGYGDVIQTSAGALNFKSIIHCVAINNFFETSPDIIQKCLEAAFTRAAELGYPTLVMPTLATGTGAIKQEGFAKALKPILEKDFAPLEKVTIVIQRAADLSILKGALGIS